MLDRRTVAVALFFALGGCQPAGKVARKTVKKTQGEPRPPKTRAKDDDETADWDVPEPPDKRDEAAACPQKLPGKPHGAAGSELLCRPLEKGRLPVKDDPKIDRRKRK